MRGRPDPFIWRLLTGLVRPAASRCSATSSPVRSMAVGEAASRRSRVGDRVFGYDEATFGAHAEYLIVRQDASGRDDPRPAWASSEVAPGTEGSHYALAMHPGRERSAPGSDVLVYGATGAIGSAAVQLLKSLGAHGDRGLRHREPRRWSRGLGADRVVDYTAGDFTEDEQTVRRRSFDAVGKSTVFGRCKPLLKPGGTYLSTELGTAAPRTPCWRSSPRCWAAGRSCSPCRSTTRAMIVGCFEELLRSGAFRPVVDRRYPLDRIADAYRYVETEPGGSAASSVTVSPVDRRLVSGRSARKEGLASTSPVSGHRTGAQV